MVGTATDRFLCMRHHDRSNFCKTSWRLLKTHLRRPLRLVPTSVLLFLVCHVFIRFDVPQSEDNILESKIRLLKSQLKEKSMEAEHAASSLLGAQETLENAREVRELNEQIMQLQSTERKLKAEVRVHCYWS